MKIETLEISGFRSALAALRMPYGKEARSETTFSYAGENKLSASDPKFMYMSSVKADRNDIVLMNTLIKRGDEHAKVMRGIIVYAKITAPIYFFCEEETYRAGHERLCSESTMHGVAKGFSGDELVKVKSELPMGTELTKVDFFSYQCLRNIVRQRHNHRLPEWHQFVKWVRSLPFAEELIFAGLENISL